MATSQPTIASGYRPVTYGTSAPVFTSQPYGYAPTYRTVVASPAPTSSATTAAPAAAAAPAVVAAPATNVVAPGTVLTGTPVYGTSVYGTTLAPGQMGPFGPVRGTFGTGAVRVARETSDRAAFWVAKNEWDFSELPHPEGYKFYFSCILAVAAADGVLDPKEKAWIVGYAAALGAPVEVIRDLESANTSKDVDRIKAKNLGADFQRFVERTDTRSGAAKRGIIYDAIRAASADGVFAMEERKSVLDLAARFGLTKDDVVALEALHKREQDIQKEKAGLIHRFGVNK